jgi:hypothetical protein
MLLINAQNDNEISKHCPIHIIDGSDILMAPGILNNTCTPT